MSTPRGRGRPPGDTCPPEVQARLGVESDRAISRDLAVPLATVRGWRVKRGIPAVQRPAARVREGEDCPICALVSVLLIRIDYLERAGVGISARLEETREILRHMLPPSVQRREVTRER